MDLHYLYTRFRIKLYGLLHRHPLWTKQPLAIQIDTQTYCNLNCIYCNPQNDYVQKQDKLSLETIKKLLNDVKKKHWLISSAYLYMNGEPLLEDRLPQISKLVKDTLHCHTILFTNGSIYTNRYLLADKNIDEVRFTISAATRSTYKLIHGKDLFNDVIKTLDWLTEHKKPNQTITINYILCQKNIHELELWKKLFKGYNHDIRPVHDSVTQHQSKIAGDTHQAHLATNSSSRKNKYSNKRPCCNFATLHLGYNSKLMHCCVSDYIYNYGVYPEVDLDTFWKQKLKIGLNSEACKGCTTKDSNWEETFKKYVWNKT